MDDILIIIGLAVAFVVCALILWLHHSNQIEALRDELADKDISIRILQEDRLSFRNQRDEAVQDVERLRRNSRNAIAAAGKDTNRYSVRRMLEALKGQGYA